MLETSIIIAKKFNVEVEACETAALIHDITKEEDNQWNEESLIKNGIQDEEILRNRELWHSQTAILFLKNLGIEDSNIIEAVKYHTIGKSDMSDVGKVLYVADFFEPNRNISNIPKIGKFKTLDEMVYFVAKEKLKILQKQGKTPHHNTLDIIEKAKLVK